MTNDTRKFAIRNAIAKSTQRDTFIFDGKQYADCPVITIDINIPYYRLANTRTKAYQKSYLSMNTELPDNYFSDEHQLNDEQQEVQRTLLEKDLNNEQEKALMKSFEKFGGQDEALIMTDEGIIVNGNRRLCFMRMRGESDVKVLILPDSLNNKLQRVEAFLDYTVSTKVDYDWRAKGQIYYEMHNGLGEDKKHWTYEDIAKELFVHKNEVENLSNRYYLAAENLRIRGLEDKFDELDKSEQIHKDCVKQWKKKGVAPESHKPLAISALILLDSSTSGGDKGRRYTVYNRWMRYPEVVREVISEKVNIPKQEDKFGDGVDMNIIAPESLISLRGEDGTFKSNQINIDEIVDKIIEKVSDKEEEEGDLEDTKRFINMLHEAYKKLTTALNNLHEGSDLDDYQGLKKQIDEKLETIDKHTKDLGS